MRRTATFVLALSLGFGAGLVPSAVGASTTTVPRLGPAPNCRPAQLRVSVGAPQGAAGTIYHPIIFTNTRATCVIWGVPHVQPVAGPRHRPVGPAAANMSVGMMPARHLIGRGQSVSDGFGVAETGNYPASRCRARSASGVVVSLTPFVGSTYVRLAFTTCTVQASTRTALIVPGRSGA